MSNPMGIAIVCTYPSGDGLVARITESYASLSSRDKSGKDTVLGTIAMS